jgi:hypothetical protein
MSRAAEARLNVPPPQLAPDASRRPASLFRAARTRELYLVWHFGYALRLEWQFWIDPLATLRLLADVAAPAMSRRDRAAVAEAMTEVLADETHEPRPTPAMLEAATRWFCGLRRPADEGNPWTLQPLARADAGPTGGGSFEPFRPSR